MKKVFGLFCLVTLGSCHTVPVSIDGQSYFVEDGLAHQIAGLPDTQKLARIQRSGLEGLNQQEQLTRIQRMGMVGAQYNKMMPQNMQMMQGMQTNPYMVDTRMTRAGVFQPPMQYPNAEENGLKEISIGGKSYFVDPLMAQEMALLPVPAQMAELKRLNRMNRMQMGSGVPQSVQMAELNDVEDNGLKEISIGGKSYFVDPFMAREMALLPVPAQMAELKRLNRMQMRFPQSAQMTELDRYQRMGSPIMDSMNMGSAMPMSRYLETEDDLQEISMERNPYLINPMQQSERVPRSLMNMNMRMGTSY